MQSFIICHTLWEDIKFAVIVQFVSGNRYLCDGAADWHEILHGDTAASRTGLPPLAAIYLGVSKWGSNGGQNVLDNLSSA